MKQSEIRQNRATKQWVIFAPSRGKRPHDFRWARHERENLPALNKDCPFCPGNEPMLGPAVIQMTPSGQEGWQTKVILNKFPALTPEGDTQRFTKGIYTAMKGYGRHEVIIESPQHNQQIASMSREQVITVIETYHQRCVELMQEHENMMVLIFRNHGARAGTSLRHPHSQLIVTGMVPRHIRSREEEAERYFDEWGRCVYCDILEFEMRDRRRVILENRSFLGFIPFAAEVPFEIWIVPKNHQADFAAVTEDERSDLALALHDALCRLHEKLSDPDYNYIINTSARYRADEPQLHWYLQIRPRLTTQAGFEIGSGISINPSFPEDDAEFLNADTE